MAAADDLKRKNSFGDAAAASVDSAVQKIPTGGYPQAPVADGSQDSALNTDLGRTIVNTANALGPAAGGAASGVIAGLGRVASVGGRIAQLAASSPRVGAVAPLIPPVVGFGSLAAASAPAQSPAPAVSTTSPTSVASAPATAPTAQPPAVAPQPVISQLGLGGVQKTVGPNGSTLYSDGNATSDASLMARGPISAQNMAAADALAARNDGSTEIRAAQNKAQYDQEVAAAQAFNQAQFDRNNPMTKAQLGTQALRLQQQQVQQSGAQQAASNQIAQARLGLDTATAGLDTRGRIQLLAAQDALTNAKTPEERAAAQSNLLSLQGKAREVPAQWKGVATAGSKNVDGSTNDGTVTLFNEQTGEVRQAGADKLPAGMARQVGTSGGKPVYEDASGKRFIGN